MALFGKKNASKAPDVVLEGGESSKVVSPDTKRTKKALAARKPSADRDLAGVIKKPRITEKAALLIDKNVYTFEVRSDATKYDVRDAIKEFYNVTPTRVNMVTKKPRHYVSRMRGRNMMEKGLKKAYVELKEGDRIDLA